MKTILKYLKPYMPEVIFCLVIKGLSALSELVIPKMLAIIIDENVPMEDLRAVLINGAVMLTFAVLTFVFGVIGNRASASATGKISRDIRHDLFIKTVNLDVPDTDKIGLASLTSRLTSDTYNITAFIARIQRIGLRAPLMLVGGILITLTIDYKLSLVLIAILPLVSFTVYSITKKSIPIYTEEQAVLDKLIRRVDETSSGIRVIKALSKTEYEKNAFHKVSDELAKTEEKAGKITSLTKPINDFIFYMGLCLVIFVSAIFTNDGEETAGKLLAFMTYFTIILNHMIMMSRVFVQTSRAFASASRIEQILQKETEQTVVETEDVRADSYIIFDKVTFSYNKRSPDVENISFDIKEGETLGIIGATGSGKTTIINLLLRLYDTDSGEIYINGRNVKSYPKEELYKMFGVVFQNDFLPAGDIGSNVSFFRGTSEESILCSIDIAQGSELLSDGGLSREVTTRGTNLSGGQRQRLLIARAIASRPRVLILDDSSSALDYKTDLLLRRAISSEIDTTTIIVSQRVASVRSADKILVIDEGRLVGVGSHSELINGCALYREVAEVQGALEVGV